INASTGLLNGVVGYNNVASGGSNLTNYATISLHDNWGTTDSVTLSWVVSDTNRLPTITNKSNAEGDSISLNLAGTDTTGTNTLTYSATSLPFGLSFNASTGLLSGIIGYNNTGMGTTVTYTTTVTLKDQFANSDNRILTWTVTDTN